MASFFLDSLLPMLCLGMAIAYIVYSYSKTKKRCGSCTCKTAIKPLKKTSC